MCRKSDIASDDPIVPPIATQIKSVFSEILLLFLIASFLSYPINKKDIKLMVKKVYNKIIIGVQLKFKDSILATLFSNKKDSFLNRNL